MTTAMSTYGFRVGVPRTVREAIVPVFVQPKGELTLSTLISDLLRVAGPAMSGLDLGVPEGWSQKNETEPNLSSSHHCLTSAWGVVQPDGFYSLFKDRSSEIAELSCPRAPRADERELRLLRRVRIRWFGSCVRRIPRVPKRRRAVHPRCGPQDRWRTVTPRSRLGGPGFDLCYVNVMAGLGPSTKC